jgi:hypothetical protein
MFYSQKEVSTGISLKQILSDPIQHHPPGPSRRRRSRLGLDRGLDVLWVITLELHNNIPDVRMHQ